MNDGLVDAFRHNAWATSQLLQVAQGLTGDQLQATTPGTFGSIIDTFWHIISSEASYCRRLSGEAPSWDYRASEPPSLAELTARADEMAARWDRFLEAPFDAERTFLIPWDDGIPRDVPAGVILTQALHHGTEHRAQICTILTTLGIPTPDLGAWDYAAATDRAPQRREG